MILSAVSGALNALSQSNSAFFDRALGLGDAFQMVVSDSIGTVFIWMQPPEVPKAYYDGLEDGTLLSFFKSRLCYLYLLFFLTLGLFCLVHFMYRIRKHKKLHLSKSSPSPKNNSNVSNEKGVQTFNGFPEGAELMDKLPQEGGWQTDESKQRLSRTKMTRTVHQRGKSPSPVIGRSGSASPKTSRWNKKVTTLGSETASPTPMKKRTSRHRSILLSRNACYTMRKAKPKKGSPSPPWVTSPSRVFNKKSSKIVESIPYIIKKSPRRQGSLEKSKKITKRRKLNEIPRKTKHVLNGDHSPMEKNKPKPRQFKKSPSPTRSRAPIMKIKPESTRRTFSRDPKRCKTCKKIRPFVGNTPDNASMYHSRWSGYADSLFCYNPTRNNTKSRMNHLTRGSNAVSAVLRGSKTLNNEKKGIAEDTNTNKTLRQESQKMALKAYHRNLAKLISGDKLLLSTTSANRSVHNILLNSHRAYNENIEHHRQTTGVVQTGNCNVEMENQRLYKSDFIFHDQSRLDIERKTCPVSRYEKYRRNLEVSTKQRNSRVPCSQKIPLINNDNLHAEILSERLDVSDKNRINNIQHIERQRLSTLDDNVDMDHLEPSSRELSQRRPIGDHAMLNIGGFNQKYASGDFGQDEYHEKLNEINKTTQYVSDRFVYISELEMKTLSQPYWFETQHPATPNKSFKMKSNKWRNRPKPYDKISGSNDTNTRKSSEFCDVMSTLSDESAKLAKLLSTRNEVTQDMPKEQWNTRMNNIPTIRNITQINTRSESSVPNTDTNTTSSSVNSPLNKNNCSPSRLNKQSVNKNTDKQDKNDGVKPTISTGICQETTGKSAVDNSTDRLVSLDRDETAREIQTKDTHVITNETTPSKKGNCSAIGRRSLFRRASPLGLIQRKIRSFSTPRKTNKSLRSPKLSIPPGTDHSSRKLKSERQKYGASNNVRGFDNDNRDHVLPFENLVSLGIQTSDTSLRNTSVQTSPIDVETIRPKEKSSEKNNLIECGIVNNDTRRGGKVYLAKEENSASQGGCQSGSDMIRQAKGFTNSSKDNATNSQIIANIATIRKDHITDEKTCSKAVDDVNINKRHDSLRRMTLPYRSSSCTRTPRRQSSYGSSPTSVLLDGHQWMGRPRWEDADVDEINRRVERALKLREELQKHKQERLQKYCGRTLSCEPVMVSSSCVLEECGNVDAFLKTHSSRSHEVLNDGIDTRGCVSYYNKNINVLGESNDIATDTRLETNRDFQNGRNNMDSNSETQTDKYINSIRIIENRIQDPNMPNYSSSNRKLLLSSEQCVMNESETTDINVKTLPFNTDHAESDMLHTLYSVNEISPHLKNSRKFRFDNVDKTRDNLNSPLDLSLASIRLRNSEGSQSYHGDIKQSMINNVRVRSASTRSFSRLDDVPNDQGHSKAIKDLPLHCGEPNENSPPVRMSKTETPIECDYPPLVGELVKALPHVPLASFVEWFIETSNPIGSDNSASPEINHINIQGKDTPLSNRKDTKNNPAMMPTNRTDYCKNQAQVSGSDKTRIETPVEFLAGDISDNHACTLSDSTESNAVYKSSPLESCDEQMRQVMMDDDNDIDNNAMMTSIRRIWLTRESPTQQASDCSDVMSMSDRENSNIISFRGSVPLCENTTPKSDNLS